MKKAKSSGLIIIISLVISSIGSGLATWKMFQFRDRLHQFVDNSQWERTLSENGMYDKNKIIFFGDSEIDLWWMCPSFGIFPIKNKGISGDWASKAVNRFKKDVLDEHPQAVVILIGTNDLGNGQPVDDIIKHIDVMIEEAVQSKIRVILCSLLPVRYQHIQNHPPKILIKINQRLKSLALRHRADYVDFYTHLTDQSGLFRKNLTNDGLHPNWKGYLCMSKILLPYLIHILANPTPFL